jgi:hypothetical protein
LDLAGAYSRFQSIIGLDDEAYGLGTVQFLVVGDGVVLYDSGLLHGGQVQQIDVSVAGVNDLALIVKDGFNGISFDHADWADAKLLPG